MRKSKTLGLMIALATTGLLSGLLVISPASAAAVPADTSVKTKKSFGLGMYNDGIDVPSAPRRDVVQLGGMITDTATQAPLAGVVLKLERKLAGKSSFQQVDYGTTDSNGQLVLSQDLKANAKYRFIFSGNTEHAAAKAAAVKVKVMHDLNAQLVSKGTVTHKKAWLKGKVRPDWAGKKVFWQKKACGKCSFKTVAKQKAGKNGSWKFRAQFPRVGHTFKFRAKLKKSNSFVTSYSAVLKTTRTRLRPVDGRTVLR